MHLRNRFWHLKVKTRSPWAVPCDTLFIKACFMNMTAALDNFFIHMTCVATVVSYLRLYLVYIIEHCLADDSTMSGVGTSRSSLNLTMAVWSGCRATSIEEEQLRPTHNQHFPSYILARLYFWGNAEMPRESHRSGAISSVKSLSSGSCYLGDPQNTMWAQVSDLSEATVIYIENANTFANPAFCSPRQKTVRSLKETIA